MVNRTQQLSNALKTFRRDVPDYVASGFVDVSSGMLLAIDTVDSHPREIIGLLAAATTEMPKDEASTQIEMTWKRVRGLSDDRQYPSEVLLFTDSQVHLFIRSTTAPDVVAVVFARAEVNVGMFVAQVRRIMRETDAAA